MTDGDDSDEPDGPMEALVALVAVVTLPAGILAAVYLGEGAAGVVFVVGWLLLVPALAIVSEYVDPSFGGDASETATDPLDRLRDRYAAGEIDEAEFERRLERLIETEDVDVEGDVDPVRLAGTDRSGEPEPDDDGTDREGDREPESERV